MSERRFVTPLIISGTNDNIRSMAVNLKKIGYRTGIFDDLNDRKCCIITWFSAQHDCIGYEDGIPDRSWDYPNENNKLRKRIKVNADDTELVLALALMNDDPDGVPGEYVKYVIEPRGFKSKEGFTTNKLYKLIGSLDKPWAMKDDRDFMNGCYPHNHVNFVKATVQEIIDHFNKSTTKMKKTCYGWRVKSGVSASAAARSIGYQLIDGTFSEKSSFYKEAKKEGVLELLFEPIYEEPEKIMKVAYERKGKFLNVRIKDNMATFDYDGKPYQFTKGDLKKLFEPFIVNDVNFRPSYFNIGCIGQFKNVKADDIMDVMNAL